MMGWCPEQMRSIDDKGAGWGACSQHLAPSSSSAATAATLGTPPHHTAHQQKKGQPLIEVDLCAQDRTRSAVPQAQASADTLLAQTLRSSNEKLLSAQPTPPRVIYWAGAQSRCEALMTRVPDGELAHNIRHPRHRVPPQRPLWARQHCTPPTAHQQKKSTSYRS